MADPDETQIWRASWLSHDECGGPPRAPTTSSPVVPVPEAINTVRVVCIEYNRFEYY
jgi:hypothetical protein